jgi:hypothetical protein
MTTEQLLYHNSRHIEYPKVVAADGNTYAVVAEAPSGVFAMQCPLNAYTRLSFVPADQLVAFNEACVAHSTHLCKDPDCEAEQCQPHKNSASTTYSMF